MSEPNQRGSVPALIVIWSTWRIGSNAEEIERDLAEADHYYRGMIEN
jgi:hypothetical protein